MVDEKVVHNMSAVAVAGWESAVAEGFPEVEVMVHPYSHRHRISSILYKICP